MPTKTTITKQASSGTTAKQGERSIQSLLAKLRAAPPPKSEGGLARWVLLQMLTEMATRLANQEEMKFSSTDALKIIQAIKDLDADNHGKKVSKIKVEWVEPERP